VTRDEYVEAREGRTFAWLAGMLGTIVVDVRLALLVFLS
jgi:hypothetical protein